MTEEKRTSTAWAKHCLAILQEIDPSYKKNRDVKGRFIEFIREDSSGLTISHNFIKIRDDYHYSFALTFLTQPTELLYNCMVVGSRFDHNRTIWRQFDEHLGLFRGDSGYPSGVWSSGIWRSNTIDQLQRGLAIPEEHLLPFYRQVLFKGKNNMVRLFEYAQHIINRIPDGLESEDIASLLEPEFTKMQQFHRECSSLDGFKIAQGGKCKFSYGPPEPGFNVESIPLDVIVASQISLFLQERNRLDNIVDIARRL